MGLDVQRPTSMSLFRPAQHDMTLSLADNLIPPELPGKMTGLLEKITTKPMIRRLDFPTMQGMFIGYSLRARSLTLLQTFTHSRQQ